jgi:hypothetical protein
VSKRPAPVVDDGVADLIAQHSVPDGLVVLHATISTSLQSTQSDEQALTRA